MEQEYPLHACEQPGYISKFTEYGFLGIFGIPEWMKEREVAPLNQCSETPFGIFYVSDPFETDGTWGGYAVYFLGSVESAFDEQMAEALSKVYEEGTKPGICSYTAYLQKNAAGETVKSLGFSHDVYCASFIPDEDREAVSCMYALFDQPVDLSEGTLVLADGE